MAKEEILVRVIRSTSNQKIDLLYVKDGWERMDGTTGDAFIIRKWYFRDGNAKVVDIRLNKTEWIDLIGQGGGPG